MQGMRKTNHTLYHSMLPKNLKLSTGCTPFQQYKRQIETLSFKKIDMRNVIVKKCTKMVNRHLHSGLFLQGGKVSPQPKKPELNRASHQKYVMKQQVYTTSFIDSRLMTRNSQQQQQSANNPNAQTSDCNKNILKTHKKALHSHKNHIGCKPNLKKKIDSQQIVSKLAKPRKISIQIGKEWEKSEGSKSVSRKMFHIEPRELQNIKAENFLICEYPSGNKILGNNSRRVTQIASLTKIMTFYAVISIVEKCKINIQKDTIEIDEQAEKVTGTSADVSAGDTFTIEQLLYGLMLPSGNDAAFALATWAGSVIQASKHVNSSSGESKVASFIKLMNDLAKQLGLKNTRFANPHGLPHQNSGSTCEDLAELVAVCLRLQVFKRIIRTSSYTCKTYNKYLSATREIHWENTNKLLRRQNFIGVKTGVTVTAGACLATCYEHKSRGPQANKIFIVILLKTNKLSRRFKETRAILALALQKMNQSSYSQQIEEILRNDPELDSDNSEDEEQFCFAKNDAREILKRNKIVALQI